MFEFDSARSLWAEENERKPNQYVAKAMRIGLAVQLLCLLFNEVGIFHVHRPVMWVCTVIGALCALVPQVIAYYEPLATNPKSKYFVVGCACLMSFVLSLALFIFSAPLCFLPMLLAVQYNSVRLSRFAIAGSCVCVALGPPMGCVLGLWESEFLRFLLSAALGGEAVVTLQPASGLMAGGTWGVALYLSLPWLMCTLMLGKLIMTATRKGEDNIENRLKVLQISRVDALTGLYNQNVYEQYLNSPVHDETVGVIFFDVDGLKRTNDANGHEYGDLLLRRCADSLREIFDDHCHGFRVGGDEFLVVVDTDDPQVLEEKLKQWRQAMERVNLENRTRHKGLFCHMSVGTAFGDKCELSTLIIRADKRMYREKEKYHQELGLTKEERI